MWAVAHLYSPLFIVSIFLFFLFSFFLLPFIIFISFYQVLHAVFHLSILRRSLLFTSCVGLECGLKRFQIWLSENSLGLNQTCFSRFFETRWRLFCTRLGLSDSSFLKTGLEKKTRLRFVKTFPDLFRTPKRFKICFKLVKCFETIILDLFKSN